MSVGRLHVFCGPSLPHARARALLPTAVIHGPVRHLSILELALHPGDVVGIVDGALLEDAPVRHKELLHVMHEGIEVWGAGGIGALRAAELGPFGMRGVGLVHRLFDLGVLERDDEVIVPHGDAGDGYRQTGDALVSLRVTARRARRSGLVDRAVERRLVEIAASLPLDERSRAAVARLAADTGADVRQCAAFRTASGDVGADVKRQDAELLLHALGRRPRAPQRRPGCVLTRHLADWLHAAGGEDVDGERVSDLAALTVCQAFARDYPAFHRQLVLRAIGRAGATATSAELEAAAVDAAAARGLLTGHEAPGGALHAWLTDPEWSLPAREALIRALVRSYRHPPGIAADPLALDALRETAVLGLARQHAARARRFAALLAEREPRLRADRIPEARVRGWFAQHWELPASPAMFELHAHDRGFVSNAQLARGTRTLLPHAIAYGAPEFGITSGWEDQES